MRNREYYRQFKKEKCERCGFRPNWVGLLHVHHKNHKHWDDRESNFETLCKNCHEKHHRNPNSYKKKKRDSFLLKEVFEIYNK